MAVKSDVKTGHDIAYVTRGHASGCTGAMAYYTSWEPRCPKSQATAYFKSLRTMKRKKIAPTTYNAALPAWRQAVFRWLRAVVLDALSDCHRARASPER